jgi:type IV secretory pathway VirJ component
LIEVPASGGNDTFAILLSGDGGWAGLDKEVANALVAKGIAVVGFDSLRYFWKARQPQELADDIDRVVRHYAKHWGKNRVVLIGYSQGADVLPFAVNRLPDASRTRLAQTVLMGLGQNASFEFHLADWIGKDDGLPILPEAVKLNEATTLCLYGEDEDDSLCPDIPRGHVHAQSLPGGHHFDGAYDKLADLILQRIATPQEGP